MRRLVILVIVALLGWQGYRHYQSRAAQPAVSTELLSSPPAIAAPAAPAEPVSTFKCDGRTHCSQMTSCGEATYFLRNCPNVKMDGNNDGVPCEQQWCRR
ncbi:MAG: excalibur calcium-binding domain-containing protein [Burkholderiales bacterium]|nr:excalibur calcium-binding domain-containing protein [Burkholderiales bacterium]